MPRYRCLFAYETKHSPWVSPATRPERTMPVEVAYEFEAPDLSTLETWLKERRTSTLSIEEMDLELEAANV